MLKQATTHAVVVEPRSHEDVEAQLRIEPDSASARVEAHTESFDFILQAKSRSTGPWSAKAISDVLTGKEAKPGSGPQQRARPLTLLAADVRRRYVFVTNESVAASLRSFHSDELLDWPGTGALPAAARRLLNAADRASVEPRVAICSRVTRELLQARIERLLTYYGHVPANRQAACLRDLRDTVRQRMLGHADGRWTKKELLTALAKHCGSVLPRRAMDHYVRPQSFNRIRRMLAENHAVLIVGSSGTGKTLTADILEHELRHSAVPFDVVYCELGPASVRAHLSHVHPVLFHLRDPWGSNRLSPDAGRWNNELPKLLREANDNRKFLITSRSDILNSGWSPDRELQRFMVPIEIEDYGSTRLAEIYDGLCKDLSGHALDIARTYRQHALRALQRPFELDRFVVALGQEDPAKPRPIASMIADSQIDAIAQVVADQVTGWGEGGGIACATVLWALIGAHEAVAVDVLRNVGRELNAHNGQFRLEMDAFIEFLVQGRNVRQEHNALTFHHPRVEDGLRMAIESRPGEAEHILSQLCTVLVHGDASRYGWGLETVLGISRAIGKLQRIKLHFDAETQEALDIHLSTEIANARTAYEFGNALRDLARYGSAAHVPSQVARTLLNPHDTKAISFDDHWHPPDIGAGELAAMRVHPLTETIVTRFVSHVLASSRTYYRTDLVEFLSRLCSSLDAVYWKALRTIAKQRHPANNIHPIVAGACSSPAPDFDTAIQLFVDAHEAAESWHESFAADIRRAHEHEIDAVEADHVIEQPSERYYNADEGLQAIARLRWQRQGIDWLRSHPHRALLVHALSRVWTSHTAVKPTSHELRTLIQITDGNTSSSAWRAVAEHWDSSLLDLFETEVIRADIDDEYHRKTLIEIAAAAGGQNEDWIAALARWTEKATELRKLELVLDVVSARIDRKPSTRKQIQEMSLRRGKQLAQTYPDGLRELALVLVEVLSEKELPAIADQLSAQSKTLLETWLPQMPLWLAGPFSCLAAACQLDIVPIARKLLLSTDDINHGKAAMLALSIQNDAASIRVISKAIHHSRYHVRREALQLLAHRATSGDRPTLLGLARDPSADVRLAFAKLMGELQWPEAIKTLISLLKDRRDFSSDPLLGSPLSWSNFRVAKAAAEGLGAYQTLPAAAISSLIDLSGETDPSDPLLACEALRALALKEDSRVLPTLIDAMEAPGLEGSPAHKPRGQAAGWSLFERATCRGLKPNAADVARLIEIAIRANAAVAAPAIATAGWLGGKLMLALLDQLRTTRQQQRVELLLVACAIAGHLPSDTTDPILESLARRAEDHGPHSGGQSDAVSRWSFSLDATSDVQGTTAWLAATCLKLPVLKPDYDPREYVLPKRMPVLTMRSLTPEREETDEY